MENLADLQMEYGLTPSLAKVLVLLLENKYVTVEALEGPQADGEVITSDARVAVHRLRGKLEPRGLEIQSRLGVGYWLEKPCRETILEQVGWEQDQEVK